MQTTPFWWEDVLPIEIPNHELPARADVVIVGSGYTGLSAALALLKAGRSVVILEQGRAGEGASSRNGGMCGDQLKPTYATLCGRFGSALASRLYGEARDALLYFEEFIQRNQIACDFRKVGRLTGATSKAQLQYLEREAEALRREVGIPYEMLSKSDLEQEIGTDAYVGARLLPHHGGIHPAKYLAGLLACVLQAGGHLLELTRLVSHERRERDFLLKTQRGDIAARDVVIATNGYTAEATPAIRSRIVPVTSYMIATVELSADTISALMPRGRMITDTNRLLCYYRPAPDQKRILFGGRPAYTEISPDRSAHRLKSYLTSLFPVLRDTPVSHSWFGMIGYAFDHLPHVGQLDGLNYAGGYCGSGVVMATWLGEKLANRVLCSSEGATAFAEIGHPGHIFYRGRPWFLPVVQAWYQLADLWDRR